MTDLHVVFRVATAEYVLSTDEVLQMESYRGATPVPGAAPWIAGLVHVRGRVVPVVDLRVRFGLPAIEPTLDSRIVVVQREARTVGLLVDSARDVIHLGPDQLRPAPAGVRGGTSAFVKAVAAAGDRLLLSIDLDPILEEESRHGD